MYQAGDYVMLKKSNSFVLVSLLMGMLFSACTGGSLPVIGQSANTGANGSSTAALPQSTRTVLGILKLEGTPLAVTAVQANMLVVLYKAAKSMSATAGSSPAELTALYAQIDETLTPAQNQAVTQMNITAANMRTIMSELGIQAGATGTGGNGSGARTANGGGGGGGGGFSGGGGGGIPGVGGGGGGGGIPGGGGGATTTTRPTSVAGASSSRQQQINPGVLTAVIDLLSKRAGLVATTPTPGTSVQTTATPTQVTATPTP